MEQLRSTRIIVSFDSCGFDRQNCQTLTRKVYGTRNLARGSSVGAIRSVEVVEVVEVVIEDRQIEFR